MQISVLGMGRMGRAIAARVLSEGHQVVVWNRTPGRAGDLVAGGATEASSAAEAAGGAEAVVTMLSADEDVRQVVLGEGAVAGALGDQAVLVDCSTVSPAMSEELAGTIRRFVAMPVLGNPDAVRAGVALLLVGGPGDVVGRIDPLVAALGGRARRYERPALAAAAKLTSNLLLLQGLVALAESFAVGTAGGLSQDQLRQLLEDSPLVAPALRNRFEAVLTGRLDSWWTTALGAKDGGLALELGESKGATLPAAGAVLGVYREMIDAGHGEDDIAAVHGRYLP